jgi:hypothetical protein
LARYLASSHVCRGHQPQLRLPCSRLGTLWGIASVLARRPATKSCKGTQEHLRARWQEAAESPSTCAWPFGCRSSRSRASKGVHCHAKRRTAAGGGERIDKSDGFAKMVGARWPTAQGCSSAVSKDPGCRGLVRATDAHQPNCGSRRKPRRAQMGVEHWGNGGCKRHTIGIEGHAGVNGGRWTHGDRKR